MRKALLIALFAFFAGCIPSPTPKLVPIPPQEPDSAGWIEAAKRIQEADGLMVAKITELSEDWQYDDPCGIVAIALHRCEGTVTYKLHIENAADDHWLWTFALAYGTFGLFKGEEAVFIWRQLPIKKLKECKEYAAMSSAYCGYDILDVLTSNLDVLPVVDSLKVDSLRHVK